MGSLIDLTGQRFGRLIVLGRGPNTNQGKPRWNCQCDCGNITTPAGSSLQQRLTVSCGCFHLEETTKRLATHGEGSSEAMSPEYGSWHAMRGRCLVKSHQAYERYGRRGITICERWLNSFENFLADMGRKPSASHSIDRIDVDGNYDPSNCRWATPTQQTRNRRPRNAKAASTHQEAGAQASA